MQNPAAHASGFIEHDDHCHRAVRSLRVECYWEDSFNFRPGETSIAAIARIAGRKNEAAAKVSNVGSQRSHLLFVEAGSRDITQHENIVAI